MAFVESFVGVGVSTSMQIVCDAGVTCSYNVTCVLRSSRFVIPLNIVTCDECVGIFALVLAE